MEFHRLFYRKNWFVFSFLILLGFYIQGIETYFDPNHPNSFDAFLYAHGEGAGALLPGIFPLVISLFAGSSLAWDRRTGFETYLFTRTNYRIYLASKLISTAISSFVFVLLTDLIAFLYSCFRYSTFSYTPITENAPGYVSSLYMNSPFGYVFLIMLNGALAAIAIAFISVVISIFVKNIYIVLALPWLLFLFLQFALYVIKQIHYAPLDLLGLYMLRKNYSLLEIPSVWCSVSILLLLVSFLVYSIKYRNRGGQLHANR
jgi:hypothetical protein